PETPSFRWTVHGQSLQQEFIAYEVPVCAMLDMPHIGDIETPRRPGPHRLGPSSRWDRLMAALGLAPRRRRFVQEARPAAYRPRPSMGATPRLSRPRGALGLDEGPHPRPGMVRVPAPQSLPGAIPDELLIGGPGGPADPPAAERPRDASAEGSRDGEFA